MNRNGDAYKIPAKTRTMRCLALNTKDALRVASKHLAPLDAVCPAYHSPLGWHTRLLKTETKLQCLNIFAHLAQAYSVSFFISSKDISMISVHGMMMSFPASLAKIASLSFIYA